MTLLLRGGRVIDPASGLDEVRDVLVEDGRIARVDARIETEGKEVRDCSGRVVCPGFVDLHARFREPGREHEEDIASGSAAAAAGGFTTVCVSPETQPANDGRAVTEYMLRRCAEVGLVRLRPMGALTRGLDGDALADMAELQAAGCVAVCTGDGGVDSAAVMRRAMEYAATFGIPVVVTCEDRALAAGGAMHEGAASTRGGLAGRPGTAEVIGLSRDLELARLTGARMHVSRLSTAQAVTLLGRARDEGLAVTAGVTTHHLIMTDEACLGYDPATKVLPPLRTAGDVARLRDAIGDGTLAAIVSDHAPEALVDKEFEFVDAAFGMTGLETVLPRGLRLVGEGVIDLGRLVELLTSGPARVFGLEAGTLAVGAPADIAVFDPDRTWALDASTSRSKARNTPLWNQQIVGRAVLTIMGGTVTHEEP